MADLSVMMRQGILSRLSDQRLASELADFAIAIALRTGKTPQHVLRIASEHVAFSEEQWRSEVEPDIRAWIEREKT